MSDALSDTSRQLRVQDCIAEAKDVVSVELVDPSGRTLPTAEPGAHLEITLGNGLIRHYSLCHDPRGDRSRYRIAVGRASGSRGGSSFLHQSVRVGDLLTVRAVRNQFPMVDEASSYRFIAGGIGITPILAMIERCVADGVPWSLLYCVRSRFRAAFLDRLAAWPDRVRLHVDDECGGRLADLAGELADPRPGEHVYCCGPTPLMEAVRDQGAHWPEDHLHFEWFSAPATPVSTEAGADKPFKLVLRRSGLTLDVPPGQTMLEVVEAHGIDVPFSCREGMCRTCETPLCQGEADHRDFVLSPQEKASQQTVMLCVSRALSDTLEIDL